MMAFVPLYKEETPEFSFPPPCEYTVRRLPSANHGEHCHQEPNLLTSAFRTS